MKVAIGVDIGGTNTVFGIVNNNGKCLSQGNIKTTDYPKIDDFISSLVKELKLLIDSQKDIEVVGVGVGAPNANFFNGCIEFAPNLAWEGVVPLVDLIKIHFINCPVFITNDANAAAIGERIYGAAKGVNDFVMVTLGTGLGSGFVVNGDLVYGHDGFAGELGHTIVEKDGRPCGCGRNGCLETYASATGIVKTAQEFLAKYESKSPLSDLDHITSKAIADAAHDGDKLALEIFDYTAEKLGFSLANTVALTSPKLVVLFGGLAQSGDLIMQPTKTYMESYLLKIFKNKVSLKLSMLKSSDAAVLGASALAWQNIGPH